MPEPLAAIRYESMCHIAGLPAFLRRLSLKGQAVAQDRKLSGGYDRSGMNAGVGGQRHRAELNLIYGFEEYSLLLRCGHCADFREVEMLSRGLNVAGDQPVCGDDLIEP